MKIKLTLALLGLAFTSFGQYSQPVGTAIKNIDVGNINTSILTGGDMFHNLTPTPNFQFSESFEVPRGSGVHSIFGGALWISGRDIQQNLYVSAQTYRQGSPVDVGYWPGPIGNTLNQAHNVKYDKIWKVSKAEIQYHIQNYTNPGYTPMGDLATWPGNGNIANGEAAQLAPYVDLNNDGIYSPAQGDYPAIKGDQALYVILNDKGNVKEPVSPSMNAEIHVMYYAYNNPANNAVYNTLFSDYRIINRGQINLRDFYAGIWVDFDLGNWSDDYVGCDTTRNQFFVYNGDNYDNDTASQVAQGPPMLSPVKGYGANPPVQAVTFLDQKMSHFMYYTNDFNPATGNPTTANHFYNFMRGFWKNNMLLTYGGDGTNQSNPRTKYMFPGDPVTGSGWSERNTLATPATNVPYDRRGLGTIGPFTLNAGQELKFTVAYTYSRGTSNLNSVTQAHTDALSVQNFFRNQVMSAPKPLIAKNELQLFPNPAQNQLSVKLPAALINKPVIISITDYTGRTVLQKPVTVETKLQTLNIESLSKGVYQVSVTSENQKLTSRLVKL